MKIKEVFDTLGQDGKDKERRGTLINKYLCAFQKV